MPNTKNTDHVKSVSDAADKGGPEAALKQVIANIRKMIDEFESDLPGILSASAESGPGHKK